MAETTPLCPDCQGGYQPEDNYCRQCGMYLAALRDTAIVAAAAPGVPVRTPRQRTALPAPVKKAATAMAFGTALQIGVSLTGKYLARQAGKQALNAVARPKSTSKRSRPNREVTVPQQAAPADPYPHAAAVSETVVVRRVWIRR
jgi:predicted amidophosphoribosyltransferase